MAFFYDANPPWAELQAFDLVVVDPGHVPNPKVLVLAHTRLAAYVALGEVQPSRDYAAKIPTSWIKGENKDWGSRLINQAQPDWPQFFTELSDRSAVGERLPYLLLDTLDSYHLFSPTPEAWAAQEAGMVKVITTLKQRFPQARLILTGALKSCRRCIPWWNRWWRSRCFRATTRENRATVKCLKTTDAG